MLILGINVNIIISSRIELHFWVKKLSVWEHSKIQTELVQIWVLRPLCGYYVRNDMINFKCLSLSKWLHAFLHARNISHIPGFSLHLESRTPAPLRSFSLFAQLPTALHPQPLKNSPARSRHYLCFYIHCPLSFLQSSPTPHHPLYMPRMLFSPVPPTPALQQQALSALIAVTSPPHTTHLTSQPPSRPTHIFVTPRPHPSFSLSHKSHLHILTVNPCTPRHHHSAVRVGTRVADPPCLHASPPPHPHISLGLCLQ